MAVQTEESTLRRLVVTREPEGKVVATTPETEAKQAVMDACVMIGACWVALIVLWWSVKRYNV